MPLHVVADPSFGAVGPLGSGVAPRGERSSEPLPAPVPFHPLPRNILVAGPCAHPGMLRALAREAQERHWHLITDMMHTGALPTRWQGDGILAFVAYPGDPAPDLENTGVPCVTLSTSADCRSLPRVQSDDAAIGRLAARHLLERGCREFLWAPFNEDTSNRERLRGFQAELQAQGFGCDTLPPAHRRIGRAWHDNGREWQQATASRLAALRAPAGLFAFNDCLSAKVLALAQRARISVPEQLAILGVGNDPLDCESTPLSLSSIDLDAEGLTARAARLLDDLLSGSRVSGQIITCPPGPVVTRDSTGTGESRNLRIHQAVAYVAAHSTDPDLSVATVADRIGISRRQLERDFRVLKGCTVREFIEEIRMNLAARLVLEQPQVKILTIPEAIGISDPNSFFRKFRRKFGVTPTAFRRQFLASSAAARTQPEAS